ncbi:NAD(P)-binding protein [Daedalea quercina L-15889]|uniref:NAD(P)-binding protein n=1 Tax=Daedalea quercina L-15889 TaxID=1314783 RepID=A0A165KP64_9APHY|nr:NAD(P)-binding protein [Daedalea quercina L-15889]
MATTIWLITGANRGLGLELTTQLLATSPANEVIAACRNPARASDLHALQASATGRVHVVPLDVSSEQSMRDSVRHVADVLGERGLDYLYNNAAINPAFDSPFDFDYATLLDVLQTNLAAPALLAELYYPFLLRGDNKTIVNVTTGLASLGLDCGPKCTSYSISKCALNMLTYKQARTRPDFTCICMDPGWVKTALGGEGALLETADSAAGILAVISRLTPADSGKFWRYNGTQHPW